MSAMISGPERELSLQLAQAHTSGRSIAALASTLIPEDAAGAYRVQGEVLALRRESIGGWKVGAKSLAAPIQGAPLPASGVHASPHAARYAGLSKIGLELEIGFVFGQTIHPGDRSFDGQHVIDAVSSVVATIEIVSSRFELWPGIDKLAQLADFQNHGMLVVSAPTPCKSDFDFIAPRASFQFNGTELIVGGIACNPAGDPRRLLPWLVKHCSDAGITIEAGCVVTAGSYSGMYFPSQPGTAIGLFDGLPPVVLTLN